jgi:general secretion pathway protein D
VPLQTAAPKEVADELTTIFGPKGSVPLPGMLSFAPLERMSAILVVSPQRAYVEQARMWIERLDRGEVENKPEIYEYHVQNSRAVDVARVLTQLFTNGQVSTVQPQTAPGTTATTLGTSGFGGTSDMGGLSNVSGGGTAPPGLGTGLSAGGQSSGLLGSAANAPATGNAPAGGPPQVAEQSGLDQNRSSTSDAGAGGAALPNGLDLPPIRVVADEKNNTLVIYARPRDYQMVETALKRIDVPPLEVLIEATIAEVTLGNDLQYGLQYFFHQHENQFIFGGTSTPISAAASTIAGTFPGFNYIVGSTNANVVLNLLSGITNVHVISSPELLVLDHQSASLLVGSAIPIPTAQIQSTVTTGAPIVNTVQYVDTGVILKVTPRVNANGLITLEVGQEVSAVAATSASTNSTLGPTITERRLQSSVTVQDGETVALGGLIQDTNSLTKNGLPLLSDIPVIGAAFGTTDHNVQRTELLVLLSPKIVHNAADARAATDELRSRLHSLQGGLP